MARTIQSPGVEIKEFDLSENPSPAIGTYTFTAGFADKGPTDEILQVTSVEEFEQIYGKPTTPAERYFYHSVTQQFNSQANVLVGRLPYGYENGEGFSTAKMYSILAYPIATYTSTQSGNIIESKVAGVSAGYYNIYDHHVVSITKPVSTVDGYVADFDVLRSDGVVVTLSAENVSGLTPISASDAIGVTGSGLNNFDESNLFIIQKPKHFELTEEQYLKLQDGVLWQNTPDDLSGVDVEGDDFIQKIGKAGIIIVNKAQTTINDQYEGYYIGIADNMAMEPKSEYESILSVEAVNGQPISDDSDISKFIPLPDTRMNFTLSGSNSISQMMEDSPSFSIFGSEFDDTLVFNVFKLRKSLYADSTIKLDASISESYTASVDFHRQMQSQNGGAPVSFFIEKKAEDSTDIQIMINPYMSGKKSGKTWLGDNGKPTKKIRVAFDDEKSKEFNEKDFDIKYSSQYGMPYSEAKDKYSDGNAADALFALGVYQAKNSNTKVLGSIPNKLSRILSKIDNRDLFELDITVEAGLGTIWSYYKEAQYKWLNSDTNAGISKDKPYKEIAYDGDIDSSNEDYRNRCAAILCDFNDEDPEIWETANKGLWFKTGQDAFDGNGGEDAEMIINYRTINNTFINFAQNDRKDHMHICDPLRFIFLQGANKKTLSDKSKNFSQHIYWPLRYQFMTANTSYAATYGNWAKVYDAASDDNIWIPMSGVLANTYANTDSNYFCWYAPAGPDRGVLTTVSDIAFSPALKQRDQLYKISINPIYQDPNMGFVVFGQKTLQSKPSSFDRVNVRRLFLYLEKSTYNTIKWFLFRNNTYSTRTAIVNTLDPIFRSCKNNEGLYSYRIKCDSDNNTPDVIDANELKVSIYLQATRTAEFILVDFYSTKTGTNFEELFK